MLTREKENNNQTSYCDLNKNNKIIYNMKEQHNQELEKLRNVVILGKN